MIPQEKTAAVHRGLRQAFDVTVTEDVRIVSNGLSSDLAFRIVVQSAPYLLRIMTRINESMNPERIFATMSAAAEAGLTPPVRYTSAEDAIVISDFVEARPFTHAQALIQVPNTLRRLHALPAFPKAFNYVTAHNGFIWRFRNSGMAPKEEIEEVFSRYEKVCAVYPRLDSDLVSCHNDIKPENLLFDGQHLWLMGWQAALLNDRYFDLAVAANFLLQDENDELIYLEQYFGQMPGEYQCARFFLMRQVVHMLAATIYMLLGSAGKPVTPGKSGLSFTDFHRHLWSGDVDPSGSELKISYGRVHWEQLLQNMQTGRFEESLRIVSDRNRTQDGAKLLPLPQ